MNFISNRRMLSRITIKKLYGLYTYMLDFCPEKHPYCFVTGPNAYGKTTLLRMISCLYKRGFAELSSIMFDEFRIAFDDGFQTVITQKRIYSSDSSSDEVEPKKVVLTFSSNYKGGKEETFQWEKGKESEDRLNNLTAYLSSHPIYMIPDSRLYDEVKSDSAGHSLEEKVREYLQDLERELNASFQQGMMEDYGTMTEEEYKQQVSRLQPLIDSVLRYELLRKNPIPAYSVEKASFCHSCIAAFDKALTGDVLKKVVSLDALHNIIGNYCFANKKLELSPYFGFRFKAEDENATILSFGQLSSGERHIMLMNCDILFDVQDDALVLIDEPELSFHLEWQGQFMTNLEVLAGVRKDLQYIICTHAPEMFSYDWDMTVDLYQQSEKRI